MFWTNKHRSFIFLGKVFHFSRVTFLSRNKSAWQVWSNTTNALLSRCSLLPVHICTRVGFNSFYVAKNVLPRVELMHMNRKGQFNIEDNEELHFVDQFYALAGQIRPPEALKFCSRNVGFSERLFQKLYFYNSWICFDAISVYVYDIFKLRHTTSR